MQKLFSHLFIAIFLCLPFQLEARTIDEIFRDLEKIGGTNFFVRLNAAEELRAMEPTPWTEQAWQTFARILPKYAYDDRLMGYLMHSVEHHNSVIPDIGFESIYQLSHRDSRMLSARIAKEICEHWKLQNRELFEQKLRAYRYKRSSCRKVLPPENFAEQASVSP